MSKTELLDRPSVEAAAQRRRRRFTIEGRVQGVGFRPFVYRLAQDLDLTGWVANGPEGVIVEIQGEPAALDTFIHDLRAKSPKPARIDRSIKRPAVSETTLASSFD